MTTPRDAVRRLFAEPLVHFLLLGALLFAVEAALDSSSERRIVVTRAIRADLERELEARQGRPPSKPELEQALDDWRREEALYREGLLQGLDKNDAQVRARVGAKLMDLQRGLFVPKQPSAAELDAFLQRNRGIYELPLRFDFEHVFVQNKGPASRARAEQILDQVARGKPAAELGEPFADGRVFAAQSPERVEQAFGPEFAQALPKLVPGRWGLLRSKHGWHAVLLRLAEGGLPSREALGDRLLADYQIAARDRALAAFAQEVVARYEFEEAE